MGRKTASGLIFSRGGYSLTTGDGNSDDRNIRYCSRSNCGASLRYSKNAAEIGNAGRAKQNRASSNLGASSQISSSVCSLLKSHSDGRSQQKRTRTSIRDTADVENSPRRASMNPNCISRTAESNLRGKKKEESESMPASSGDEMAVAEYCGPESRVPQSIYRDEHGELGTCSTTQLSTLTSPKQVIRQSRCDIPESSYTSMRCFSTTTNTGLAVNHTAQSVGVGIRECSCRNSKGSAMTSDVAPTGFGRKVNAVQKRYLSGRSSFGRDKSSSASPSPGLSPSVPSASEDIISQQSSTRSKKHYQDMRLVHNRTNMALSREARTRQREQVDTSSLLSEHTTSVRLPKNELGSASVSSTRDEVFRAFPVNREGNQNFSMEGVAQLLLTLERIEQDEQTYEEVDFCHGAFIGYRNLRLYQTIYETSWGFFIDGINPSELYLFLQQDLVLGDDLRLDALSFIDQHRDMRMDIDNMTYEELIALEEKIGTVSTALTEEALLSCLVRSTFKPACSDPEITNHEEEEARCSICQEEYALGEDLGKLACSHRYHVTCIHQWFRLKNWCPICKAYVSPKC